jgi:hypothetical protein
MLESALVAGLRGADAENKHFQVQARAQLFSPGQPMALDLAKNPTALVVNRTLFAHGGVLPEHGEQVYLLWRYATLHVCDVQEGAIRAPLAVAVTVAAAEFEFLLCGS